MKQLICWFRISPGVPVMIPTPFSPLQAPRLLGLGLMPSPSWAGSHQCSCGVSWPSAGSTITPPAATRAAWRGSRGMQTLPINKWMLLLDPCSFGKLGLRTGTPMSSNTFNNVRLCGVTVCLHFSSDVKSSSEMCLCWFIYNSAIILMGGLLFFFMYIK